MKTHYLYIKKAQVEQAAWDAKGFKTKQTEIVEAFKNLATFDEYINTADCKIKLNK